MKFNKLWNQKVAFAIRSHRRPEEALKTFLLLRSASDGIAIRCYVQQDQVDAYRKVFGGFAAAIHPGGNGSGGNFWSAIEEPLFWKSLVPSVMQWVVISRHNV